MGIGEILLIGLVLWVVLWYPELVGKLIAGVLVLVVCMVGFVAFMLLLGFMAGAI